MEERELTVIIAVDISSSTFFGSDEDDKRDKMAETAALLAFSAIRNNDKVGLLLFSDRVESYIPPRSGRAHVMRVIRDLVATRPRGRGTNIAAALESLSRTLKKKTVIFLISDFMDQGDFWKPLRILNRRHDLAAIRVVDSLETALPSAAALELEDSETGECFAFPGSKLAAARYAAAQEIFDRQLEENCRQAKVDLIELPCTGDIVKPLMGFFQKRGKRKTRG